MFDETFHLDAQLLVPVLDVMLIPRPFPSEAAGHLGLELWTHAAMMAPLHLSQIPNPMSHFRALHDQWMTQITNAENRLGTSDLAALDQAELQIRQQQPWATEELTHPIWDGHSDDLELDHQLIPEQVLGALERYLSLREAPISELLAELSGRRLEVAVMLVEADGSAVLAEIKSHTAAKDRTGTGTSSVA